MADKEPIPTSPPTPPANSVVSANNDSSTDAANTAEKPRPVVRRPRPVYKPATESLSLQPIGGGAAQPTGAPIGASSAAPAAAPDTPSVPSASSPPTKMGGLGALNAPSAAPTETSATTTEPAAPVSRMGGLASVGQMGGGGISASNASNASSASAGAASAPGIPAPLAPPTSTPIPYPSSSPMTDRRPVSTVKPAPAESGFNASSAVKIGLGVLAAVLAFFVVSAMLPSKIPVPEKFKTYNSGTGAFALDAPDGWNRKGVDTKREDSLTGEQSDSDTDGVTITYGKAVIEVWTDSGGKAMQNQLLSGSPNFAALLDDKHKEFLGNMKKHVGNFQGTEAGSFNLGPFGAKVVDYTGKTGFLFFGGKVHGLAATVHGPKHFMMIYLQCPESNWVALKPVYEQVLKSAALDGVSAKTIQERLGGGFGGAPGGGGGGGIRIPGGGSVSIPPGVGGF